jgi:hypothetical protein
MIKIFQVERNLFSDDFDSVCIGRFNVDITRALLPDLSEDERKEIGEKKDLLFRQFAQEKLQPTKGLDRIIEYIKQNRSKLKIGNKKKCSK